MIMEGVILYWDDNGRCDFVLGWYWKVWFCIGMIMEGVILDCDDNGRCDFVLWW